MALESIFARRSIRAYTGEPVSREAITQILEAGMAAPSSNNRKPWHFVVIRDRATLTKLAEAHPHGKMLSEAAAAIAVCGDTTISPDFWVQDCAAATENMLVAVAALGPRRRLARRPPARGSRLGDQGGARHTGARRRPEPHLDRPPGRKERPENPVRPEKDPR